MSARLLQDALLCDDGSDALWVEQLASELDAPALRGGGAAAARMLRSPSGVNLVLPEASHAPPARKTASSFIVSRAKASTSRLSAPAAPGRSPRHRHTAAGEWAREQELRRRGHLQLELQARSNRSKQLLRRQSSSRLRKGSTRKPASSPSKRVQHVPRSISPPLVDVSPRRMELSGRHLSPPPAHTAALAHMLQKQAPTPSPRRFASSSPSPGASDDITVTYRLLDNEVVQETRHRHSRERVSKRQAIVQMPSVVEDDTGASPAANQALPSPGPATSPSLAPPDLVSPGQGRAGPSSPNPNPASDPHPERSSQRPGGAEDEEEGHTEPLHQEEPPSAPLAAGGDAPSTAAGAPTANVHKPLRHTLSSSLVSLHADPAPVAKQMRGSKLRRGGSRAKGLSVSRSHHTLRSLPSARRQPQSVQPLRSIDENGDVVVESRVGSQPARRERTITPSSSKRSLSRPTSKQSILQFVCSSCAFCVCIGVRVCSAVSRSRFSFVCQLHCADMHAQRALGRNQSPKVSLEWNPSHELLELVITFCPSSEQATATLVLIKASSS